MVSGTRQNTLPSDKRQGGADPLQNWQVPLSTCTLSWSLMWAALSTRNWPGHRSTQQNLCSSWQCCNLRTITDDGSFEECSGPLCMLFKFSWLGTFYKVYWTHPWDQHPGQEKEYPFHPHPYHFLPIATTMTSNHTELFLKTWGLL